MTAPHVFDKHILVLAKLTITVSSYSHEGTVYALIGLSGGPIIGEVFES